MTAASESPKTDEISTFGSDRLLFHASTGTWFVSLTEGLYQLNSPESITAALEVLPTFRICSDDDEPLADGTVSISRRDGGLDIAAQPTRGDGPFVGTIAQADKPSLILLKGRSLADPWRLSQGAWLLSHVRVAVERAAALRIRYYLPPHTSGSKRLLVRATSGASSDILLQRGEPAAFEIGLAEGGCERLDLFMDPEPVTDDERLLGFVFLELTLSPRRLGARAAPMPRLDTNLWQMMTWLDIQREADFPNPLTAKHVLGWLEQAYGPPSAAKDARDRGAAARGEADSGVTGRLPISAFLVFDPRRDEWFLSLNVGLFTLADATIVADAAAFLPIIKLRQDDDETTPAGEATLLVDDEKLEVIVRAGGASRPTSFSVPGFRSVLPSGLWTKGRSITGSWALAETPWLLSVARLECENTAAVQLSYFLPPGDPASKNLRVTTSLGHQQDFTLQRGQLGTLAITLVPNQRQSLEFVVEQECTPGDPRPLGFVLIDLVLVPARGITADEARRRRMSEALRQVISISGFPASQGRLASRGTASADYQMRVGRDRSPRRVAVVCWDLGHNPAGRAAVLYRLLERDWEPQLIGPIWQRFGRDLWAPMRGEGYRHRLLHVSDLRALWVEAAAVALESRFDLVVISKPRLPAILLGLLIAEVSGCPIIVDIDESEHAFRAVSTHGDDDLVHVPFGDAGTQLALSLISVAGSITVSNPCLQGKYGGYVVRHARDEDAPLPDRAAARARLGFLPDHFVIAFVGTVRAHKGLLAVLEAIERLADGRIRLLVVGTVADQTVMDAIAMQPPGRVLLLPNCRLSEIGRFLVAADLVPILQDPNSEIAQTQLPAKLTDALQFGVAVVATDVPPLRDLAARGVIDLTTPETLIGTIRKLVMSEKSDGPRPHARRVFEEEFGYADNRARLEAAIREAKRQPVADLKAAIATLRRATVDAVVRSRPSRRARTDNSYDVAVFWKQNDSDLFGRRSDMVVKYLLQSGRVRRIVHFDQAIAVRKLQEMALARADRRPTSMALELPNTILRCLEFADTPTLSRRVMLTSNDDRRFQRSFCGRDLLDPTELTGFVIESLNKAGLDPASTLAWGFPIVWGFAKLVQDVRFRGVILDLVDDQRTWSLSAAALGRIDAEYGASLAQADLVFTNGEGNRERFAGMRDDIIVISNGAEPPACDSAVEAPGALAALTAPIIGYAGNMNDRVDWPLVDILTAARPNWNFVFIGPYQHGDVPKSVIDRTNVHFLGPVRYSEMMAHLRCFTVAIMPHLISAMTDSMNPLKLYNYLMAGLPVVATAVKNLEDVQRLISVPHTPGAFLSAIEAHLHASSGANVASTSDAFLGNLGPFEWSKRIDAMLGHVDARFDRGNPKAQRIRKKRALLKAHEIG